LTPILFCRKRREQFLCARKSTNRRRTFAQCAGITPSQVLGKALPRAVIKFHFDVCLGKDFPDDLRVRVAVGNYRADISHYAKGADNRLVERSVTVLRAGQRAVEIKQDKSFHKHADIRTVTRTMANQAGNPLKSETPDIITLLQHLKSETIDKAMLLR